MAQSSVLRFLRRRMKAIFWFTAIVFIGLVIFGWGADLTGRGARGQLDANIAGKVDDFEISYMMYRNAIQYEYEQAYRQEKAITEAEAELIADRTWWTLVDRHLAEKQLEAKGIGELTPAEIFESLRRDPPDAVKNLPSFQQDGKFSIELFRQYLGDPQIDWMPVEMLVRSRLPYDKLRQLINSTVFVTNAEAYTDFEFRNTKAAVSYIEMDPFTLEDFSINTSPEAIKAFYEKNQEKYRREETAVVNYAKLPIVPSAVDSAEAKALAENLIARLEEGEDFEYIASSFSGDQGTKYQGGNLGWITRGQMVAEFDSAVFEAEIDKTVGPVLTQFGYHIIRVYDKEEENEMQRADVAHVLISISPSVSTEDSVKALARNLTLEVQSGRSFLEFVEKHGIDSVGVSVPFVKDQPVPGIGYLERPRIMCFEGIEGSIETFNIRLSERPILNGITVLHLVKRYPAGIPQLDEIRDEVTADMELEARKEAALNIIGKAKSLLSSDMNMRSAAEEVGARFDTTGTFSMNAWIEGIGSDIVFKGRVYGLRQPGSISAPFIAENGKAYSFRIERFEQPNPQDYQSFAMNIKNELLWGYRYEIYERWFMNLRENSEIVDNRFAHEFGSPEETE